MSETKTTYGTSPIDLAFEAWWAQNKEKLFAERAMAKDYAKAAWDDKDQRIAQLESDLAAANARIQDLERLNVSTHELKESYKEGWIEQGGKAHRFRHLFKFANAAKRQEREMRIDAQESNWEATKYIAAIGRVIGNDRDPNKMETAPQVIQRIIEERDAALAAHKQSKKEEAR